MGEDGALSPSAFIPFCEFGAEKSVMGQQIAEFDVPVCNKFRSVTMKGGQVCYQVDVSDFEDSVETDSGLRTGLTLWLDYNQEKQVTSGGSNQSVTSQTNFADKYLTEETGDKALIYVGTLGRV